jgi:hypothetical protein
MSERSVALCETRVVKIAIKIYKALLPICIKNYSQSSVTHSNFKTGFRDDVCYYIMCYVEAILLLMLQMI